MNLKILKETDYKYILLSKNIPMRHGDMTQIFLEIELFLP